MAAEEEEEEEELVVEQSPVVAIAAAEVAEVAGIPAFTTQSDNPLRGGGTLTIMAIVRTRETAAEPRPV